MAALHRQLDENERLEWKDTVEGLTSSGGIEAEERSDEREEEAMAFIASVGRMNDVEGNSRSDSRERRTSSLQLASLA